MVHVDTGLRLKAETDEKNFIYKMKMNWIPGLTRLFLKWSWKILNRITI